MSRAKSISDCLAGSAKDNAGLVALMKINRTPARVYLERSQFTLPAIRHLVWLEGKLVDEELKGWIKPSPIIRTEMKTFDLAGSTSVMTIVTGHAQYARLKKSYEPYFKWDQLIAEIRSLEKIRGYPCSLRTD